MLHESELKELPDPSTARAFVRKALLHLCEEPVDSDYGDMVTEAVAIEAVLLALRSATPVSTEGETPWKSVLRVQAADADSALHVLLPNNEVVTGHYLESSEAEYTDEDPTPGWFGWDADVYVRLSPQPTHFHPKPKAPALPLLAEKGEGHE